MKDEPTVTDADREAAKAIMARVGDKGLHQSHPWVRHAVIAISEAMAPERARAARMEKALRELAALETKSIDDNSLFIGNAYVRDLARAALEGEEHA